MASLPLPSSPSSKKEDAASKKSVVTKSIIESSLDHEILMNNLSLSLYKGFIPISKTENIVMSALASDPNTASIATMTFYKAVQAAKRISLRKRDEIGFSRVRTTLGKFQTRDSIREYLLDYHIFWLFYLMVEHVLKKRQEDVSVEQLMSADGGEKISATAVLNRFYFLYALGDKYNSVVRKITNSLVDVSSVNDTKTPKGVFASEKICAQAENLMLIFSNTICFLGWDEVISESQNIIYADENIEKLNKIGDPLEKFYESYIQSADIRSVFSLSAKIDDFSVIFSLLSKDSSVRDTVVVHKKRNDFFAYCFFAYFDLFKIGGDAIINARARGQYIRFLASYLEKPFMDTKEMALNIVEHIFKRRVSQSEIDLSFFRNFQKVFKMHNKEDMYHAFNFGYNLLTIEEKTKELRELIIATIEDLRKSEGEPLLALQNLVDQASLLFSIAPNALMPSNLSFAFADTNETPKQEWFSFPNNHSDEALIEFLSKHMTAIFYDVA